MFYLFLSKLFFLQGIKSYKSLLGLSTLLITCLLIFSHLWKVVSFTTSSLPLKTHELLWYITLNEWILLSVPSIHIEIEQEFRDGHMIYLLTKPISYLKFKFFQGLGTLLFQLAALGGIAFSFTTFMTKTFPFTFLSFTLTILLGISAAVTSLLFHLYIGLFAFWLHEVSPMHWIWQKFSFILGGLFIPLSLYPNWLQTASSLTPFPWLLGERSLCLFDPTRACLSVACALIGWGSLSLILLTLTYKKIQRQFMTHGG
ncbi:MAG: ABC-2 family transporter protein [Chlamydiia bacterium]|nr:ABC-2 family transporter protein [Chlamydiia bacterium]